MLSIEEHRVDLLGIPARYLAAGTGSPLVLLHALGENAADWRWVMPVLGAYYRVYAPDLPSVGPWRGADADYSPSFFGRFVEALLDALGLQQAAVVGNSLGGLAALHLALNAPERVTHLVLVGSGGLGRSISPALSAVSVPGLGEASVAWGRTPLGALQRAWGRASLLFAQPARAPRPWMLEHCHLSQQADFLPSTLATLRAQVDIGGQREILLDRLPELGMPTLVIWGDRDRIVPIIQAHRAVERLRHGQLCSISDCGHLPQVEHPERFVQALVGFLPKGA
jgi:pimeloyl-ACP methyl ester carboxylesterase